MRPGRLDRRVTIQRKTVTQSASGDQVVVWTNVVTRRPASMRPVKGDERFTTTQIVGNEQVEFTVRYSESIASLSPQDRVIYPALTAAETENDPELPSDPPAVPAWRRIHEIMAVHEIGRREGLKIITIRRPDVLT